MSKYRHRDRSRQAGLDRFARIPFAAFFRKIDSALA